MYFAADGAETAALMVYRKCSEDMCITTKKEYQKRDHSQSKVANAKVDHLIY